MSNLIVETTLIRQAAEQIDQAAAIFRSHRNRSVHSCPLQGDSLGRSAEAREVTAAAAHRVVDALEVADRMADLSVETAGLLRSTAVAFDAAESEVAPPR